MSTRFALLFLVGCHLENTIADDNEPAFDDGDPVTPPGGDTDTALVPDTGSPREETGSAECPPLDLGNAGTVAIREECAGTTPPEVSDPWNVAIEWTYDTAATGVIAMPAVGNLTDDNGDGVIDENDVPDIAFTIYGGETLVALSGDGSGVIFQKTMISGSSGVAIADVDGDGSPEIVANGWRVVTAVRADGSTLWTSAPINTSLYTEMTVCDLDEDGTAEVIMDGGVVNGEDGSIVATLSTNPVTSRAPVCADLDRDGTKEIILGNKVYAPDGAVLWGSSGSDGENFAAVLDADGDDGGEVLFVSEGQAYLYDDDGTALLDFPLPGDKPGAPCVADFDGDGSVEVAIPANTELGMFELDGTEVWSSPISDGGGYAGCSGFDFDADGAYEVLMADETSFRIHDGATGTVRYEDPGHNSWTLYEYPVIADVDADGEAEVVVAENFGARNGITVYGNAGDGWPASGPTWSVHDFGVTNVEADGGVPASPEPPWLGYDVFRARPAVDDMGAPDLAVAILDACVTDCDAGPVQLSVQVSNEGARDVAAGHTLAIYADDGDLRLVASVVLPAIAAGERLEGIAFELTPADLGAYGLVAMVDDGEALAECDETNNSATWVDVGCP